MPRKYRPRWRRIICLDSIAIYYKNEITVPGWLVLLGTLTSPIWGWYFLPRGIRYIRSRVEAARISFYAGRNIGEKHTARPVLWRMTPPFLCQDIASKRQKAVSYDSDCPLSKLPYEIRKQIWLQLLCPADTVYIKHDSKQGRLYSSSGKFNVHQTAVPSKRSPPNFEGKPYNTKAQVTGSSEPTYVSYHNMARLLKVNRQL